MFVAFVLARKIDRHGENTSHKSRTQQQTLAHTHTLTYTLIYTGTHSHMHRAGLISGIAFASLVKHRTETRRDSTRLNTTRLASPRLESRPFVLPRPWSWPHFAVSVSFSVSVLCLDFPSPARQLLFFFPFLVCKIRVCNLMFLCLISFSCAFQRGGFPGWWVVGSAVHGRARKVLYSMHAYCWNYVAKDTASRGGCLAVSVHLLSTWTLLESKTVGQDLRKSDVFHRMQEDKEILLHILIKRMKAILDGNRISKFRWLYIFLYVYKIQKNIAK